MTRKTAPLITCLVTFAIGWAISPNQTSAQEPQHYSHKELHRLIANASRSEDYQKLAVYFRYQELVDRAKAQSEMDAYADCVRNFTSSPKFQTRADVTARLYDYYSFKADENAKRARRYEEMLTGLGIRPAGQSVAIVPLRSLQKASAGTAGSALVEESQPARNH